MQTHFSPEQLADPQVRETDRILRACVHCGFCTATCPTYLLTGDELDSPRGRIYLAKDMLEKNRPADATTVKHLDRCLTCLSCMTTCPSGVHYMHLVDHARQHIERTYQRPLADRLMRWMLAFVLPNTTRFRVALWAARVVQPIKGMFPKRMRALLDAAGGAKPRAVASGGPGGSAASVRATEGVASPRRARRMALLPGCVQPALRPEINAATERLLARLGVELIVAKSTGCCGALVHHLGREHDATHQAKADINAWTREIEAGGLDAIVVTTSGCGTMIKDYGFIFRDDPEYAENAKRVSALARDVSEVLTELMPALTAPASAPAPASALETTTAPTSSAPTHAAPLRVAYHSACSLQHGQKLHSVAPKLLRNAGYTVIDAIPESHICCGSAGTYSMLQPEMSAKLRDRKARNIESTQPDVIATGNIGCMTQIEQATGIPIVHTVELLDWATGGPPPARLREDAIYPVASANSPN